MLPIENPVALTDVHATIYKALGIAADTNYVTEGRPFYRDQGRQGQGDRRAAGVAIRGACELPIAAAAVYGLA